jgi:hypothetical protein
MKRLSISLILTVAAIGATSGVGGTGCGGSSGSGGSSGGPGDPLMPNADGFFDGTNAAGVLGAWYAYGDWYGGSDPAMPMPGGGDCPMKGGYTADQCSSIAMPTPGQPFNNTGGMMCTSGTAAKVLDMMYSAIWGAGIGFDTNNAGADGGTGKNAWDASAHGVTGLAFHIDMPPTGGQMRVEFPTNAVPGTTDINAAYWGGETMNLSPFTKAGDYSFHWTDVGGPMYLTPHMPFDKTKIVSVQFHVVTNTSSSIPFNYCISNLRTLKD